jgi:hypothetical protein
VATPEELAEDRRRWLAAKEKQSTAETRPTTKERQRHNHIACPLVNTEERQGIDMQTIPPQECEATDKTGSFCAVLVYSAAWRACGACGALVLFVDGQARTDSKFTCGRCDERSEALGMRCRPSLPLRSALHLHALFSTANNSGEARS